MFVADGHAGVVSEAPVLMIGSIEGTLAFLGTNYIKCYGIQCERCRLLQVCTGRVLMIAVPL